MTFLDWVGLVVLAPILHIIGLFLLLGAVIVGVVIFAVITRTFGGTK